MFKFKIIHTLLIKCWFRNFFSMPSAASNHLSLSQGIIEGPDEFAEGVARGAQSLMGHVVGGTADSLNLISSAVGNTIAMLSFDQEYRKVWYNNSSYKHMYTVQICYTIIIFMLGCVD